MIIHSENKMVKASMKANCVGMCFSFLVLLFVNIEYSQAQTVYLDSLYTTIEKSTYTYYNKPDEELKLDLFEPIENRHTDRPVILYVHGGGFSGGERDHPVHEDFLRHFARKGYVTATMSYTLQRKGKSFGCDVNTGIKIETFLKTARDINRAAEFLIRKKEEFAINPSKIVIVGSSAGAEAVLHAAYWNLTKSDSTGVILQNSFQYGGVISMAGAILDINHIINENAIPTQLFHGTDDQLVPYGIASHHYCPAVAPGFLMLFGAHAIMKRLQDIQSGYYLMTGINGKHEWNSMPLSDYRNEISDFVYHDVLLKKQRQINIEVQSDP
jgi:dienelactone hydrolase